MTKTTAQTLLAQVYLQWAGAPLNGGTEYYSKAADIALKVINGGKHALINPMVAVRILILHLILLKPRSRPMKLFMLKSITIVILV